MSPEPGDLVVVPVTVRSLTVDDQLSGYVALVPLEADQARQLDLYVSPVAACAFTPGESLELVLRRPPADDCAMVAGTPETVPATRARALERAAAILFNASRPMNDTDEVPVADAVLWIDDPQKAAVLAEAWVRLAQELPQS